MPRARTSVRKERRRPEREPARERTRPDGPHNPGERDYRAFLLDRRITADLRVKRSADSVVRLEEGWRASLFGWFAVVRGWGTRMACAVPSHPPGCARSSRR